MSRATLRPSPNEEAKMMQDEFQRRRTLRILQVREQEKVNAIRIRRATQEKHDREINVLAHALEKKWLSSRGREIADSEDKFKNCLKDVGRAHEGAKENAPNQALRDAIAEKQQREAQERGLLAMKHQKHAQELREQESMEVRRRRHVAMIKERVRAKHIANLPPPNPNPTDWYFNDTATTNTSSTTKSSGSIPHRPGRYAVVRVSDHESMMTTTVALGLPSDAVVERATDAEKAADAREDAEREGERIALLQAEKEREVQECMEKARVRHQAALESARLDKESKTLLSDLRELAMKDGLRRQRHVDYKWDDNALAKKACQELFGPPGLRFQESQMLGRDLQQAGPDSDTESTSLFQGTDSVWHDASDDVPVAETTPPKALNRLMKQIHAQRQQRKGESVSSSNSQSKEDSVVSGTSTNESNSAIETNPRFYPIAQTSTVTDTEETNLKSVQHTGATSTKTDEQPSTIGPVASLTIGAKTQTTDMTCVSDTTVSSEPSKCKPESLLESSLENVRNDEALLKSVKEFQRRILRQRESCAIIQEQIDRLEVKRADIDARVEGVKET